MNQLSTSTAPRSLEELKVASKQFVELLPDGASDDLQAFFDEIFSSALAAIAAVDPHEAICYPLGGESPLAGKFLDSVSRQEIRDELRSAVIPLLLTVFVQKTLSEKQSKQLLMLLTAHFGLSKHEVAVEMLSAASTLAGFNK